MRRSVISSVLWTLPPLAVAAAALATAAQAELARPGFVADGDFSVCLDPTFPPMEFFAAEGDTEPSGVDIDVARALAALWGATASFQPMEFTGILPSLAAGRCDAAISGMLLTEERLQSFDGVGYLNTFMVVAGRAGEAPIASVEDLAGRSIAVQAGTTYLARMEAINAELTARGLAPMDLQQYPKQTDAILQLVLGRVSGVVTQDTEIAWRERQDPGKFAVIWTVPQDVMEPYAIYLRKSETDRAAVAAAVDALIADGTMAGILADWGLSPQMLEGLS